MRHIVRCCLALAALSCSETTEPAADAEGASAELVRSMCDAYGDYVLACAVDTDGFGAESCNAWFAKYYRRDVIESFRRCYASRADSCQDEDCLSRAVADLKLALEQNPEDPLVHACAAHYADCSDAPSDTPPPARCANVLLYTREGRERAARCFTEVDCSNKLDCSRFPDAS